MELSFIEAGASGPPPLSPPPTGEGDHHTDVAASVSLPLFQGEGSRVGVSLHRLCYILRPTGTPLWT
jgi:hypothetical protein